MSFTAIITDNSGNLQTGATSSSTLFIDTTVPTSFTTGAVTSVGGTVVSGKYNSTNTSITVTVPIANDSTLSGGTITIQSKDASGLFADLESDVSISSINTNQVVSISDTDFEAFSQFGQGDTMSFTAIITDTSGNATTGTTSSSTLFIDTTAPTVSGVTSTASNGSYLNGEIVVVQVNFTEDVTVDTSGGTPFITLSTGNPSTTNVSYSGGSGNSTLRFNYTVAGTNFSTNLDYSSTSALSANGGTIRDSASNDATLTLPTPGATGSLAANKSIQIDNTDPNITGVTLASDNSTLTVTFSESVYNTIGASGDLEVGDFTLAISGGTATINATPSTIAKTSQSVWVLGLGINGTPDGSEELSVLPASATSIYDSAGNAASSTTQTNNTVTLYDQASATFSSLSISEDNILTVVFTESVYSTSGGTGNLENPDFTFSLSGGSARLSSTNPTNVDSVSTTTFRLSIGLNGTPDGDELLIVNPTSNSIFDASGNVVSSSQNNNKIYLHDEKAPAITSISVSDNDYDLFIEFGEPIYSNSDRTGPIQPQNFDLTLTGGNEAIWDSSEESGVAEPYSVTSFGGPPVRNYKLVLPILRDKGPATGDEVITFQPSILDPIFDGGGNLLPRNPTNNSVNLYPRILICFVEGSKVTTDQGIINIEDLIPRKHTIDNQEIIAVPSSIPNQLKYLMSIEKDTFGENIPNKKTIMTHNHKIYFKNELIQVKKFLFNSYPINISNIRNISYNKEKLYNVLLKSYSKMKVNNMYVETLDPNNPIARKYFN